MTQEDQNTIYLMSWMQEYIYGVRSIGMCMSWGIVDNVISIYHGTVFTYESSISITVDLKSKRRIDIYKYMIQDYIIGVYYTQYYTGATVDTHTLTSLLHVQCRGATRNIEGIISKLGSIMDDVYYTGYDTIKSPKRGLQKMIKSFL